MPYLTYGRDMRRAWRAFSKPGKSWAKSLVKIHDPFKLMGPTMLFVAHAFGFTAKAIFFTTRRLLNR